MLDSSLLTGVCEKTRLRETSARSFTAVSTDTRTLKKGNLFVPLIGERFNGHAFLSVAIAKGANAALWQLDEPLPKALPDDFQLYFVRDTLHALQQIAKAYRKRVNPCVIAITGSNGKTTTKDLLFSILSLEKQTFKTQGNLNNHIGLPLTMLSMPDTCEYLIVEMGMNDFGEIALLSELAQPDFAIVTNIGESHLEKVGNREGVAKAKMEMLNGLKSDGFLFLDGDEPLLRRYVDERTVQVGYSDDCDVIITDVTRQQDGFTFTCESIRVHLPLLGRHNIKNASYAIAVAKRLGVCDETIQRGLENVSLTAMRLERQIGKCGEMIINDAYNASPTSMKAALETLKEIPNYRKYVAVLGDMYELGKEEEKLHREIAYSITEPITHLVCVGRLALSIADEWKKNVRHPRITVFETHSKSEATDFLKTIVDHETVVLFKASRGMRLEEIVQQFVKDRKGDDE